MRRYAERHTRAESQRRRCGAGSTYELCAGLVDKAKSLPEIAAEEARATRAVPPPIVQCGSTLPAVPQGYLAVRSGTVVHALVKRPCRAFGCGLGLLAVPHSCRRACVTGLGFWLSPHFRLSQTVAAEACMDPILRMGSGARICAESQRIWDVCYPWPHPACHSVAQALRAPCTPVHRTSFMQRLGCSRCM